MTFAEIYSKMKVQIDTKVIKAHYYIDSSLITYSILKEKKNNIGETNLEVLQALLEKLQLCQQALGPGYISKNQLIATTQKVYYRVFQLEFALFTHVVIFEELFSNLQSSIITHNNCNAANI